MFNLRLSKKTTISKILIFFFILFCFQTTLANVEENWYFQLSKINLGETTRIEVEDLFKFIEVSSISNFEERTDIFYGVGNDFFRVSYSSGKKCSKYSNGYNLKKHIVIGYFYASVKEISVFEVNLKMKDLITNDQKETLEMLYGDPKTGKYYKIYNKKMISEIGQNFTFEKHRKYACRTF